jgi:N-acetylglutamate synthase-like GNAT family acetyltransferase
MRIFYVENDYTPKYNMSEFEVGTKEIHEIRSEIKTRKDFCRDEISILRNELASYLSSGITLYVLNEDASLLGVLNFDVNGKYIIINGICVPPPSSKIGTNLLTSVKVFARTNGISQINLSCYDENVKEFYEKNEFRLIKSKDFEDEDGDEKTKYDMMYVIESGGKKTKRKRTIKRRKRTIKRRNKKYF